MITLKGLVMEACAWNELGVSLQTHESIILLMLATIWSLHIFEV